MSETLVRPATAAAALGSAHAAIDDALVADVALPSDEQLLADWRELERLRSRLAAVEHEYVLEAERRGLPGQHLARSTAHFVRGLLHLAPGDAKARVDAAEAAGHRRSLTGDVLDPAYPLVSAAQARGAVSARHATVITGSCEHLPDRLRSEAPALEAELVGYARTLDPHELAVAAARIRDHLDPDGILHDVEYRARRRDLTLHQRPDGSAVIRGETTAELAEFLLTAFDALAAPRPASDGMPDPRAPGQRRHDALLEVLRLAVRAASLPDAGGVATTLVLTMSDSDFARRSGIATTGHGARVPVDEALEWGGGDTRLLTVALNSMRAVTACGSAHRIFTEGQRLALIARDQGCSFPGCGAPPAWCQTHHVVEWQEGGPTSIDNGTLVCGYHHREFRRRGWRVHMRDRRPIWTAPPWIDPLQLPAAPRSGTGTP